MNGPREQSRFKRSRHNNFSNFEIIQDYNELTKRTIREYCNIYHIFEPNNFRDVQNLCPDKVSMNMTPNEFKYLTSTCCNKNINHSPLI